MTTIFKYPLELIDDNIIEMPKGAKILTIQFQHETPTIWAEADSTQENEQRVFMLFETGQPIPEINKKYIDTCQNKNSKVVIHVYERVI